MNNTFNDDTTDYGSIVRNNLMRQRDYTGYCGNNIAMRAPGGCSNPRTVWNDGQFKCPECGWRSQYPDDFMTLYKQRWGIKTTVDNVLEAFKSGDGISVSLIQRKCRLGYNQAKRAFDELVMTNKILLSPHTLGQATLL